MKTFNRIKNTKRFLSSVPLSSVNRPKTVEEGRENFRKYYGCSDEGLMVLLHRQDRFGNEVYFNEGIRKNGAWDSLWKSTQLPPPHKAINKLICTSDQYAVASINVNFMNNLRDIYEITETGLFTGKKDPSFTMNLFVGGDKVIYEGDENYREKLVMFLTENMGPKGDFNSGWLKDPSQYHIFSNEDPKLKNYGDFYTYSLEKDIHWRWRQTNNTETRYLHWLLLGPFAPYQFREDVEANKAA